MISKIISVSQPDIDWDNFIKSVKATKGISPTRRVDASVRVFSDFAMYVSSLSTLRTGEEDPVKALRNSATITKHLTFSFIVGTVGEVLREFLEYGGLDVTIIREEHQANVFLVSANLYNWVQIIKLIMKKEKTPESRNLANEFLRYFEQLGLGELWFDQKRKSLADGTLLLEDKR